MKIPKEVEVKLKLENVEEIKRATTQEITRSLNISASKLTDVANFETNKQTTEMGNKNINYLKNPIQAETPTERQKFMNIRSELFNRAVKQDVSAKQILSSISTSRVEQTQKRQDFIKSLPQMVPVTRVISVKVKLPQEKVRSVLTLISRNVYDNPSTLNDISQKTGRNSTAKILHQSKRVHLPFVGETPMSSEVIHKHSEALQMYSKSTPMVCQSMPDKANYQTLILF